MRDKRIETQDVKGIVNAEGSTIYQNFNSNPILQKKDPKHLTSLPPINTNFIGRVEELANIEENLKLDNVVCVINGIGGIGKSELSYKYLHEHKEEYNKIAFIEMTEDSRTLEELFQIKFQDALFLNENDNFDTIIRRLQALPKKNLILLDNILSNEDFKKIKPLNVNFDILITTRVKLDSQSIINLETLDDKDAKELFLSIYKTSKNIDDVLEFLDNHPLFINLTAYSLKEEYIDLDELKDSIASGEVTKIDSKDDKTFREHLQETFARQFIGESNYELKELLQILSLFPSVEIEFNFLREHIKIPRLRVKLQKLVSRGWLNKKENSYKLHQIIKTFILEEYPIKYEFVVFVFIVKEKSISDIYISILESLLIYFKDREDEYIIKILDIITSLYKDMMQFQKALFFQKKAISIKEKLFGKKSEYTAKSYSIIGELYTLLDDYEKALKFLENALEIRKKLFDEEHLDIAESYESLAFFYNVKANKEKIILPMEKYVTTQKEQLYTLQLENSSDIIENENKFVFTAMNNTLNLIESINNTDSNIFKKNLYLYKKALELNEKSLEIRKSIVGENDILISKSYISLASNYKAIGKIKEALSFYHKALEIRENLLDEDDIELSDIYMRLAFFYLTISKDKESLTFLKKALKIMESKLSYNHPKIIIIYSQLPILYLKMGKIEEFNRAIMKAIISFQNFLPLLKENKIFPEEMIELIELMEEKIPQLSKNDLEELNDVLQSNENVLTLLDIADDEAKSQGNRPQIDN